MREQAEPPSTKPSSPADLFLIGRNSRGNWVVKDQSGLRGALFVDRAEAIPFALFENGLRPQAVIMVPRVLKFDAGRVTNAVQKARTDPQVRLGRNVA
jgi:hypothetical protein